MKILEVNFCESKKCLKTIGFHMFSVIFCELKKSVILGGGFILVQFSAAPLLYIISTIRPDFSQWRRLVLFFGNPLLPSVPTLPLDPPPP